MGFYNVLRVVLFCEFARMMQILSDFFSKNEILTAIIIGLIAGFMQELCNENTHYWIKTILSTSFIVLSVFLIMDFTDLSYPTKLGISAIFGFLGLERGLLHIKGFLEVFRK